MKLLIFNNFKLEKLQNFMWFNIYISKPNQLFEAVWDQDKLDWMNMSFNLAA